MTLVACDLPDELTSEGVRNAKVEVLKNTPVVGLNDVVLGQYDGYKADPTIVNRNTITPTYACVKTSVETSTWSGVPFILEAGKALNDRVCEVRLHFHSDSATKEVGGGLILRLQPVPSLFLTANIKSPGFDSVSCQRSLNLDYGNVHVPDAYTKLLFDVLRGHHASFVRDDELKESWRVFTPLLHETERLQVVPQLYPAGSSGPKGREILLTQCGIDKDFSLPHAAL